MEIIEKKLKKAFLEVLNKITSHELQENDIVIEIPKDNNNGDYATNVALKYSKLFNTKPQALALEIKELFDYEKYDVDSIEIAGPGFINLFLNKANLASTINNIINLKDDYGQWPLQDHPLINVEYVSANPTGDLHLGHARQASLGDSITRLYKKAGFKVIREYYINDAGNQIDNLAKSTIVRYHELFDIKMEMPEDGYYGQDIKDIAFLIKNLVNDQYLNDESEEAYQYFKQTALQFELDKLKRDLKDFGVEFEIWTSEQALYDEGKVDVALEKLALTNATYQQDGAVWLKSSAYGDDKDRVLVKSDGTLTYLTPDIANHMQKIDNGAEYMVNLWGADHHGYIKRMQVALEIFTGQKNLLDVDIVQMVRLIKDGEEVKMSKRSGNAIGLRELCEEVGIDAVRYFFASRAGSSHFDFDLGLATSHSNDNPVYYAQYAHARMCSILEIAKEFNIETLQAELLDNQKEVNLIKHLNEFPNMVMDAAKLRAPHRVTNYIQKLASLFHSYYNECKVIDKENMALTSARLYLLEACKITLANALALIGVQALEKM
ncbi:MAG: arginine--tRNA ligase [Bacilli bacterium]|jgi:arginyl-tRNA synthetase|nr:arginine--tRNA ligase [Bacilli bacterium]